MAYVLFGNTTTTVPAFDPTITVPFDELATLETPLFDEPLPVPSIGEPAYLVEARGSSLPPRLIAVRETLEDAKHVAESVHPAAADVAIHEVQLPCDAETFTRSMIRSWHRQPDGTWVLEELG